MSSVLVEYPEGLPAPTVGEVRPTERRAISSVGQMRNTRAIQRDRHGTRTVAFTFTPEQAAIFREWWVEWLQLGGGWFAANWPLPWSRGPNVFRFKDPPQWSLIGGRLNGQGYWQVRATCEIRGRGMLPTAEVMYLTSIPYPIDVHESSNISDSYMDDGRLRWLIVSSKDESSINDFSFIDGQLRGTTVIYKAPLEQTSISNLMFIDGTSRSILISYGLYKDSSQISGIFFTAGSLVDKVVKYQNWITEKTEISEFAFIDGTLS